MGAATSPPRGAHQGDEERSFAEVRRTLHDVLRILSLHPRAFFIPFCVVASAAFVSSLYSPRTYSASTTFERRTDPIGMDRQLSAGAASFQYHRSPMSQDLTALECMVQVVENLGLTDDFDRDSDGHLTAASQRRRDGLARSLGSRLRVSSSSLGEAVDNITITYTGSDPHIGRRLVEEAKKTYILRTRQWILDYLIDQQEYYAAKRSIAKEELDRARREETTLRLDNPYVDPSDPGSISVRISQLENEQRQLSFRRRERETELLAEKQLLAQLQAGPTPLTNLGQDRTTDEAVPLSLAAMALLADIRKTDEEIEQLRTTRGMTRQHPRIVELMEERGRFAADLTQQRTRDLELGLVQSPVNVGVAPRGSAPAQPWQIERARAQANASAMEEMIRNIDITVESNETMLCELREVKQNIFQNQQAFLEVRDRVDKARISFGQPDTMLARIIPTIEATGDDRLVHFSAGSPARGSMLPIAPKAKNIILLSILLGVAAGVVFVILAEVMDHVYRSSAQVARSLGLPILDAIDEIVTAQDRRRILVHRMVVTPIVIGMGLALTTLTGSMAYLSLRQPTAYEKLRRIPEAALEFFARDVRTDDVQEPTDISIS